MNNKDTTKKDTTKTDRKLASTAAGDKGRRGTYEDTRFGRRRISKLPTVLVTFIWLVGVPVLFIYRRLRRSSAHKPMTNESGVNDP